MTNKEKLRSEICEGDNLSPDNMFALPSGYFTAQDMATAFNIPVGDDGPIPAVKQWVERHQEYDLKEEVPGKWIAAH